MARLFTAGAEETYLAALWDGLNGNVDYENLLFQYNDELSASFVVVPRSGKGCYRFYHDGSTLIKDITSASEIYWGGAINVKTTDGTYSFLRFFTSSARGESLNFIYSTAGVLTARRGTTVLASSPSNSFPANQWNYIEVRYVPHNTTGIVQVRINGSLVIDYSGDTTDGDALCWGFKINGNNRSSVPIFFDDIVINNTSGTANTSWPGQPRLIALRPAGAGLSTGMSRGGLDLGANWRNARNDSHDLAFVQSDATGEKDLYALETADLPVGAVINNVIAQVRARVEAGSGTLKVTANSNGTESQGAAETLGAGWKFYQHCMAVNPADSLAWEEADLTNLQAGMEHTA